MGPSWGSPPTKLAERRAGRVAYFSAYTSYEGSPPAVWMPAISVSRRRQQAHQQRSEEHTSELQSLMRISYAVFCLKKKKLHNIITYYTLITLLSSLFHTTSYVQPYQ